jgi:hypothetical protein
LNAPGAPLFANPSLIQTLMKSILSILAISCISLLAQDVDSDQADRDAYKDGWTSGDDGSTSPASLGAWVLGENAKEANIAIAGSAGLGSGKAEIDTGGVAFRLHDPAGGNVDVFRFIDPAGLETGETLSIDLAVNFRGGYKGVDARDGDDATVFNFNIGGDDHVVDKAATGNGSIGDTYDAHTVFTITFKQVSDTEGSWTIVRGGGVTGTTSGTYSGRIRSLKIYNGGQGAEPENALYFNKLRVLPASK